MNVAQRVQSASESGITSLNPVLLFFLADSVITEATKLSNIEAGEAAELLANHSSAIDFSRGFFGTILCALAYLLTLGVLHLVLMCLETGFVKEAKPHIEAICAGAAARKGRSTSTSSAKSDNLAPSPDDDQDQEQEQDVEDQSLSVDAVTTAKGVTAARSQPKGQPPGNRSAPPQARRPQPTSGRGPGAGAPTIAQPARRPQPPGGPNPPAAPRPGGRPTAAPPPLAPVSVTITPAIGAVAAAGGPHAQTRLSLLPSDMFIYRSGLYERFSREIETGDRKIEGGSMPKDYKEAKDWNFYCTMEQKSPWTLAFDDSKLAAGAAFLASLAEKLRAATEVVAGSSANELSGREIKVAEYEEVQRRLNGLLFLLYDHGSIRTELCGIKTVDKYGNVANATFVPQLAMFTRAAGGNARRKWFGRNDLAVLLMETVFGVAIRQRNRVGSCFAASICIEMQFNDPFFMFSCLLNLIVPTCDIFECGGLLVRGFSESASGKPEPEVTLILTNTAENSAGFSFKGWDKPTTVESLGNTLTRTIADSIWHCGKAALPPHIYALGELEPIFKGIPGFNENIIISANPRDTLFVTMGENKFTLALNGKPHAPPPPQDPSEEKEGLGAHVFCIRIGNSSEMVRATPKTLGPALADLRREYDRMLPKGTNKLIVTIDGRKFSADCDRIDRLFAILKPYADGTKPIALHGGYSDIARGAVYRTPTLMAPTLFGEVDITKPEEFFAKVYGAAEELYRDRGEQGFPPHLMVVGQGHAYNIKSYMLLHYLRAGIDCRDALADLAKKKTAFIDPNWVMTSICFDTDPNGRFVFREIQRVGVYEGGTKRSGAATAVCDAGNYPFLFSDLRMFAPLDSPPNYGTETV
ncbi:MAG: hypothetical protein LBI39_03535 [Puniceicoccales bacterium]|jgi:hypothetical protein|nr:hypothetical protein [Puniceicoccales bacterium]